MGLQRGPADYDYCEGVMEKGISGKSLIVLSLLLLVVSSGFAVSTAGELRYSLHFGEPELRSVDLYGEAFTRVIMNGSVSVGHSIGRPEVQVAPVQLLIPQGTVVESIDILFDETIEIDATLQGIDLLERPIVASQPAVPIGHPPPGTLSKDEEAYLSTDRMPGKRYSSLGVGYSHGYPILTLNVYPAQYIPAEGRLFYHPDMIVKVNLKHTGYINHFYRPNKISDREWVEALVDNPEVIDTYGVPTLDNNNVPTYPGGLCDPSDNNRRGYDYVIVTREALFDFDETYDWDDLIARKEAEGLEATKVKVEDIINHPDYRNPDPLFDDTPARIREFMKDAYMDWGAEYVLIGGDQDGPNAVERRLMSDGYETMESDLYWSNLDNTFNDDHDELWGEGGDDGFDLYSELYIGSIPADEGVDVSNWLTKSFYYADNFERDYLDNVGFYAGILEFFGIEGDDIIDYSSIYGYDYWPGSPPEPYPDWLHFQYGFETWNIEHPLLQYDISVRWTGEAPNPGWQGGSTGAAVQGMRDAINNDEVTLISGLAHADPHKSLDVPDHDWESEYHNTKPFFLHDTGCHCGDMDGADDGVLHSMLFHSDTELAFATVYNTGIGWSHWYTTKGSSALQQKSFWDYFLNIANESGSTLNWELGKAQAWSKDLMAPTINWRVTYRATIINCLLFGDPAQKLKPPAYIPVSIAMLPDNPPVQVPQGGSFTYTGVLSNNEANLNVVDVWINATLPSGQNFGPIKRFNDIELDSLETLTYEGVTQYVPSNAPLGTYEYIASCGTYPAQCIGCSDSFEFTVVEAAGGSADDWSVSGWFKEGGSQTPEMPKTFALFPNYPNPFNPPTTISYQIPVNTDVKLVIYNLLGQRVATLVDERQEAGYRSVVWDASEVSSGLYFYRLTASDFTETKRMMLVK